MARTSVLLSVDYRRERPFSREVGSAVNDVEIDRRLLDAADTLFYERGIQAVGMDELRSTAGVSLKRLYQRFPSKQHLIEAYLTRRDERWRAALAEYVEREATTPDGRVRAVFDWLGAWFAQPDFRGCAFINAFGEFGGAAAGIADAARRHKAAVLRYLTGLAGDLPVANPGVLATQLLLLVEGAIATAAITNDLDLADHARIAAQSLISTAVVASR